MSAPTPEVDLDAREEAPARARRPFPIVLVVAALAALLVSAGVRSAVDRPPPLPPSPSVSATAGLRDVVLDPDPTALLDVTVQNQGRDVLVVDAVTTRTAGVPESRTAAPRTVPPGSAAVLEVRMPIRCPDVAEGEPPPAVRVDARILTGTRDGDGAAQEPAGGGEPRAVGAVPLGELARFGGTCSSADAALPRGWRSVLPATVVRADDDGLRLRVSGPPDAEPLLLLDPDPDGWLSPGSTRVTAGSAGDITVDVGRPEIQCDRPREAPLPTTVTLFFRDPPSGPPRPHLVRVGTNLSSWLLRQWDLACPTPDG